MKFFISQIQHMKTQLRTYFGLGEDPPSNFWNAALGSGLATERINKFQIQKM